MLKYILIISSIFAANFVVSQCASPPVEFVLELADDYRKTEDLSFKLMDCLLTDPHSFSESEFDEATAFCMIWLSGAPDIVVEVNTDVAEFLDEKPEHLYIYMFALALVEKDFPQSEQLEKEAEALFMLSKYDLLYKDEKSCKSLKRVAKLYEKGKLVSELETRRNN